MLQSYNRFTLLEKKKETSNFNTETLQLKAKKAIYDNSIPELTMLLPYIDINYPYGDEKFTLCHLATDAKNHDMIKYLLKNTKIDPNLKDALGYSCLSMAVCQFVPDFNIIQVLMLGCDINATTNYSETPIMLAANQLLVSDDLNLASNIFLMILKNEKVDITICNEYESLLHVISQSHCFNCLAALLQHKDIKKILNYKDINGRTASENARHIGNYRSEEMIIMAEKLLNTGVKENYIFNPTNGQISFDEEDVNTLKGIVSRASDINKLADSLMNVFKDQYQIYSNLVYRDIKDLKKKDLKKYAAENGFIPMAIVEKQMNRSFIDAVNLRIVEILFDEFEKSGNDNNLSPSQEREYFELINQSIPVYGR